MTTLLTLVIALLCLTIGTLVVSILRTKKQVTEQKKATVTSVKFLDDNIEKIKQYARMFGLDNDIDFDIHELIEVGDRYAEFLGSDSMQEIHHAIQKGEEASVIPPHEDVRSISHCVGYIIRTSNLIERHIISVTKTVRGEQKDEEPTDI